MTTKLEQLKEKLHTLKAHRIALKVLAKQYPPKLEAEIGNMNKCTYELKPKMSERNDYKASFKEGLKYSKLTSIKQGLLRGTIHALIFAISFFNTFAIWIDIIIFITLIFIFGVIASSKRFRGKI